MPDGNSIRDTAEAVKGIVEAVPVYQDVAQRAAREIGAALETVAKCVHIALAPVSALVWGYEQIGDYLQTALTERLKGVKPEDIVAPSTIVAGPALEAMRFASEGSPLREFYANLIATAMTSDNAKDAHPAFVQILRQLTPDEARIVRLFAEKQSFPVVTFASFDTVDSGGTRLPLFAHFSILGYEARCQYPESTPAYLDNLCRLGLLEVELDGGSRGLESKGHPVVSSFPESESQRSGAAALVPGQTPDDTPVSTEVKSQVLRVTSLGHQFCLVCLGQTRPPRCSRVTIVSTGPYGPQPSDED